MTGTVRLKQKCSATERLHLWLKTLIQIKHSLIQEDPELFTMYTTLVEESVDVVNAHISELVGQIIPIIKEGIANQEFKSTDAVTVVSGIFMATARFHHPAHAKEWAFIFHSSYALTQQSHYVFGGVIVQKY